MPCETITSPDGHAIIVCSRGCSVCKERPHSRLCDFALSKGKTCDARLCERCAAPSGSNHDMCPAHVTLYWEQRRAVGALELVERFVGAPQLELELGGRR